MCWFVSWQKDTAMMTLKPQTSSCTPQEYLPQCTSESQTALQTLPCWTKTAGMCPWRSRASYFISAHSFCDDALWWCITMMHEETKIPGFPSAGQSCPFQNRRKHCSRAAQRRQACVPGDRDLERFHKTFSRARNLLCIFMLLLCRIAKYEERYRFVQRGM